MSPVKIYEVEINGVKTRMKLDEESAKRYGVAKNKAVALDESGNKQTAGEQKAANVTKKAAKKATKATS